MVEMAKPWKHPETGAYYLRRQIPAALRPAFGGRQLHKVSLGTKDGSRAMVLFLQANAELEARFEEVRLRLKTTGSPMPSSRDCATALMQAYFNGPAKDEGGLDGPGRLHLARLETDRGLWSGARLPSGSYGLPHTRPSSAAEWAALAGNAALFRTHRGTTDHVGGAQPGGVWQRRDLELEDGAREKQVDRLVEQIRLHHDLAPGDLPAELAAELGAFLDALPVAAGQTRRLQAASGRLRPDMRLLELFDEWQAGKDRPEQTASEYRAYVVDFIDYVGDILVSDITKDDLLNYRDEAAKLPAAMPKFDRLLAFTGRVAKHLPGQDGAKPPARISRATLKKRVGAIQAMLGFAEKQRWIATNVGTAVPIVGASRDPINRADFEEEQLVELFA